MSQVFEELPGRNGSAQIMERPFKDGSESPETQWHAISCCSILSVLVGGAALHNIKYKQPWTKIK